MRGSWVLLGVLACGPKHGDVTTTPTSATATRTTATGTPSATATCADSTAAALMIQSPALQASKLAEAMGRSIAVVAYDCSTPVLLEGCTAAGSYGFVARPSTVVERRFRSRAELAAAGPLLWGRPTPPLRLADGEDATISMIAIGQLRASVDRLAHAALEGDCAGATHFVRAADVGAYAVRVIAGSTRTQTTGGDLQACPKTGTVSPPPPSACQAALQLELVPIDR